MKQIGEGRESKAILFDENTVLLIGKNKTAFENYKRQQIIYKLLGKKIKSVQIPNKVKIIKPNKDYPFGALSMSCVKGEPLDIKACTDKQKITLGEQIAKIIDEFQHIGENFTAKELFELSKVEYKTDETVVSKALKLVETYLTDTEFKKLVKAAEVYKQLLLNRIRMFCHGDLTNSNLLIDENKNIIGLVDFEVVGFLLPEYIFRAYRKDDVLFKSVTKDRQIDTYEMGIVEIITMVINLQHFYELGFNEIEQRVGILRELLLRLL
ncbi:MAG: phosphotransferase [Christensenellaceae bacterium]|jgi:aminoglycoside phosphotransferase (APT) family kinase protein|nr:phosphotransferase [Christensenellaceae bacterium]